MYDEDNLFCTEKGHNISGRNCINSRSSFQTKKEKEIENPLNFTKQEFKFFQKYGLDYERFESRWKWMESYPHLIPIFFREFLFPIYNRDPSVRDLYDLGFGNFPNKIEEVLGLSYGKWKKEQGYYEYKKCTRCGQFLPIEEFEERKGFEDQLRGAYRSMCRKCRIDIKLISIYDKKYRLINNYLGGKCYDCGADLTGLDGYECHHLSQGLKTATWYEVKEKSFEEIIEWATHDRIIPLCGNCHAKRTATVFLIHKELILLENLFTFSSQQIDFLVAERVKDYRDQIGSGKNQVKKWIRKRYDFEQLFFGRCVGCGKITVYNNLPALQLHHLFPELLKVKHKWSYLANLDCEISMNIIIEEQCVALCSNCHSVIGSRFHELVDEIVNDPRFVSEVKNKYETITKRIKTFRIDIKKVVFRSPLKLPVSEDYLEEVIYRILEFLDISSIEFRREYSIKLRNKSYEILRQIPLEERGLRNPYILSGVVVYLADKIIAVESNFKPLLTQDKVSEILGINRSTISDIYNNVLSPRFLSTRQIEYNRIIDYLEKYGKATRQQIADLIGKSLKTAHTRLSELETLGLIKKEIGSPISNILGKGSPYIYWSIA